MKEWQKKRITFTAEDIPEENLKRTDPLVVTLTARRKLGERKESATSSEEWAIDITLVDTGSSVEILF